MISNINVDLFYFFNHSLSNPVFDMIMPLITEFGSFVFMLIVVVCLFLFAKYKNKKTLKRIALLALVSLLFSALIVFCLKNLINEPRPFATLDNVNLLITENDPCSFPSGHSASTLSVVTFFIMNMKDLVKKHYLIVDIALVVFAAVIPFSRIYVGVHYPFDVLAGVIIGIFCALVVNRFGDRILGFRSKQK